MNAILKSARVQKQALDEGELTLINRQALRTLAELEGAEIAVHQLMGRRLDALDALRTVAAVMAGGEPISSTRIRRLLTDGKPDEAAALSAALTGATS